MGKQLYVTNIPFQATEDDLLRLFSVAGRVKTIKLLTDPVSGKFKGCGFVEMATPEEGKEAINCCDDALLIDRQLTVVEARPSQPKAPEPKTYQPYAKAKAGKKPGGDRRPGRGRK